MTCSVGSKSESLIEDLADSHFGTKSTSGRCQFSMEFSHHAPCPKNVSDDVIAKAKAREDALRK